MEADVALEDLAETNPAQLNVFFRSIGMALPADGPRRSVHGGAAKLVQSLNWAHFGMLRELEPGEHAKHGTASASAPIKALLATLQKERGGEIAYKGGLYRVIGHGDTTHLRRGGGYEVVPPGEAVPLLQAMAADARGSTGVQHALEDAARFIDGASNRGGVVLLRKSPDRAGGPGTGTTPPPKPPNPNRPAAAQAVHRRGADDSPGQHRGADVRARCGDDAYLLRDRRSGAEDRHGDHDRRVGAGQGRPRCRREPRHPGAVLVVGLD